MVTCSCLYDAFPDNKALILTDIFRDKIDPSLVQDTLTTLQSSRVTFRRREAAIGLVADYITLVNISKHVSEPTMGRGNREARFVTDRSNQDLVNGCLSFGPAYLHRLVLAKTYNERNQNLSGQPFTNGDSVLAFRVHCGGKCLITP